MNPIKKFHEILEIKYPATKKEIKSAFHRLAHIHHPDKGGNEEKFKEINNAYQVLMAGGYWEVIAEEKKKNPTWKAKWKEATSTPWEPNIFCSDDGLSFWIEDRDGFVTSYWGPLEPLEEVIYK